MDRAGNLSSVQHKATAVKRLIASGPQMPVYLLMFVTNRAAMRVVSIVSIGVSWWNTRVKEDLSDEVSSTGFAASSRPDAAGFTFELRKDLPDIVDRFYAHCRPGTNTLCTLGFATDRIVEHTLDCSATVPRAEGQDRYFAGWASARCTINSEVFRDCLTRLSLRSRVAELKVQYPNLRLTSA